MGADEFCDLSAADLRRLYAARQLSPVEVAEGLLERIEAVDATLNAFVTVSHDQALAQAKAAEKLFDGTADPPPLAGIPFTLKDLTATDGIRTTRGSLLYKDWIPDYNAPLAQRMLDAGGVLLGKTNTPELGWKGDSTNRVAGSTHNPWQHGRSPGGSSGGAAASVAVSVTASPSCGASSSPPSS